MYKVCAFTGHRFCEEAPDVALLDRVLENLIKGGTDTFLNGVAAGFDLLAAESVIRLKKKYSITLCACIPYGEQSEFFGESTKRRYDRVLEECDEIVVLSPSYFRGCMQVRDRYLVDNCDVLINFLRKKSGGTFYTVNYARKKGVNLISI